MGRVGGGSGGGPRVSHSSHSMSRPTVRTGSSHSMSHSSSTSHRVGGSSNIGLGSSSRVGSGLGSTPKPSTTPVHKTQTNPMFSSSIPKRDSERKAVSPPPPRREPERRMPPPPPPYVPPVHVHTSHRPVVVEKTVIVNNTGTETRRSSTPSYERTIEDATRETTSDTKRGHIPYDEPYCSSHSEPPRRKRDLSGLKFGFIALFIAALVFLLLALFATRPGVADNTTNREKLELGFGYPSDTCYDEIDWIQNPGKLNRNLKKFYEKTGALPYVALVSNPEVTAQGSDAEFEFANEWYSENLSNEGYVLCMYFDSGNDYEDGNSHLIVGDQAGVLMDAEAQQVFWSYLDYYWQMDPEDVTEDEMFAGAFNDTADRIMQRRTESKDVLKYMFIFFAVASGAIGAIMFIVVRREQEAEKAAETERILAQPISMGSDPLLDKYNKGE